MDQLSHQDLIPGQNNVWYEYNGSDNVIVFVHGFFSDSKGTWLYNDKKASSKSVFWPDLIHQDKRLGNPSQFLGGYASALDSGNYGFRNCADELFDAMNRTDEYGHLPVMSKSGIIFVCHSMGGIIVRLILERQKEKFKDKRVGLVLIASPSFGSVHANRLAWLAELYNQDQGRHLKWGDALLKDLDADFRNLVDEQKIPSLLGVEAVENRFIIHNKFCPFFRKTLAVTEDAAGRYFGAAKMLRGTDHFSTVKPDGLHHPTHQLLVDFWQRYAQQIKAIDALAQPSKLDKVPDITPTAGQPPSSVVNISPQINVSPVQNQDVRVNWPSENKRKSTSSGDENEREQ